MSDAGNFAENEIADYLGANGAPSAISNTYGKLHTGAPGEAGTANAATETTREELTWDAASGGVIDLTSAVTWSDVSTTETITHISVWDSSTAGNHLYNLALNSSVALTAGDDLQVTAADLTVA